MASLAALEICVDNQPIGLIGQPDYVAIILRELALRKITLRELSLKTGLSRTRLGGILHQTPQQRSSLKLDEFLVILAAIDMTLLDAWLKGHASDQDGNEHYDRYNPLAAFLSRFYVGLQKRIIAIDNAEDIDITQIQPTWAEPLEKQVVKDLTQAMRDMAHRAKRLFHDS